MIGALLPASTVGCQVSTVTYRHLSYDQNGDKLVQDLSLSGPELGVIFRF